MRADSSVDNGCGYVVTEAGHEGLMSQEVCDCKPELVGRSIQCRKCGTLYGMVGQAVPRRLPFEWKRS
jgi:hypothetical protein